MTELLPCPFCGCANVKEYIENMGPKFQSSIIMCKGCKVEIQRSDLKARDIWNTRAASPSLPPQEKLGDEFSKVLYGNLWELYDKAEASPSDPTGAQGGQEWQVPEGWKLVPIEPTPTMTNIGNQQMIETERKHGKTYYVSVHVYKAMLAAAPPNNHNREGA